ncbi:MAG: hypothetical protein Q4A52_03870 [Bacillota bacterium]|nr:hypothetical protein [Bacillota bacterium]
MNKKPHRIAEEGSAYVWALILLIIISLASVVINGFLNADIRENRLYRDHKALYYAANSGLDLGYGALLTTYHPNPSAPNPSDGSLLNWYIARLAVAPTEELNQVFEIKDRNSNVVATADVNVSRQEIDGFFWIVIRSTGQVKGITRPDPADPSKSVPETLTLYMRINPSNQVEVLYDGMKRP